MKLFSFERTVINFKMSLSGRYLATCEVDGRMTFYDLLGGQVINSFFIPDQSESEGDKNKFLKVHDMAFSMDEKEFSCVAKKYILIYSFDKLC